MRTRPHKMPCLRLRDFFSHWVRLDRFINEHRLAGSTRAQITELIRKVLRREPTAEEVEDYIWWLAEWVGVHQETYTLELEPHAPDEEVTDDRWGIVTPEVYRQLREAHPDLF